ncbi:putative bile acid 7-alpha dehydratase protein [Phaeoacremonium minimum UCRPA7]|uniref:Putative bile acid 7-alpha dehydratase protein n=1 Tax=Phaeoacremonium minimum (strain UCR-PA7) TaxID=1286976 RepID=R8BGF7_PHAM7|nr:putative bile acid 7-alpha dehydratase protein [Phaeoacremonium minimum UCRPA7]EON98415.1 putative bile acid 7-alpha dehydratase protein [Phaeoacremonium minimum UCRPA7]
MAGTDLAARVERLEAIEDLRRLKFDYTWHLDNKDWAAFKECFTEDFAFEGTGLQLTQEDFIATVRNALDPLETSHELHQHQFDFDGPDRAKGIWRLRDHLVAPGRRSEFRGRAVYEETYVWTGRGWRIASTNLRYLSSQGSVGIGRGPADTAMGLVIVRGS